MQPTPKPAMSKQTFMKPPTDGIPVNKIQTSTMRTPGDVVHTSDIGFIQNPKSVFADFLF
jgi:hypothetical protein